jgi:hypothetical protein
VSEAELEEDGPREFIDVARPISTLMGGCRPFDTWW